VHNGTDRYYNNLQLTIKVCSVLFAGEMAREIITKFNEKDYHIFSRIANDSGLSVEEKIQEIVDVYLLVERHRFKQTQLN